MPHQCTGCGHAFEDGSKEMLSGCPECGGNKFQFRPAGSASRDGPADSPSDDAPEHSDVSAPDDERPGGPDADATSATPPDDLGDPPAAAESSVAETVGRATTRVRDFVSTSSTSAPDPEASWPSEADATSDDEHPSVSGGESTDDGIIDADARRETDDDGTEDVAQMSARSDVVSPDELDDAAADVGGPALEEPSGPPVDGDGEVVSEPTGDDPDLAELREQLNDQFESIKIVEPGQYELNLMELYDREEYIISLQENGRYVIQVPEQWIGEDPDDR